MNKDIESNQSKNNNDYLKWNKGPDKDSENQDSCG